jgi:sec-independent protein translocase protein TatA
VRFPEGWELVLVVLVIVLLFGYKKLPDATRSIGRSMRIFKSEVKGMKNDDVPAGKTTTTTTTAEVQTPLPVEPTPAPPVAPVVDAPLVQEQPTPAPSRQP